MTSQMLHATLSTGQITIWEDRLEKIHLDNIG